MAISAKQVQELRSKTGAGIMDCKKALAESEGSMEKAVDILRTKDCLPVRNEQLRWLRKV